MKTVKILNPSKYSLGYFPGDVAQIETKLADKMIENNDAVEVVETKAKKETTK